MHLQPIVRLAAGDVDGHEALARWSHPDHQQVPPDWFIPIAEEAGVIAQLGHRVLDRVVDFFRTARPDKISVNLSPRELLDPSLPRRVEQHLESAGISGRGCASRSRRAWWRTTFTSRPRRSTCCEGSDAPSGSTHFGTGSSSLGYLRKPPVAFVKLDRTLIADVDNSRQAALIAGAVFSLTRALPLITVAEGVERHSRVSIIDDMGCTFGQGWLFGRPAAPTA